MRQVAVRTAIALAAILGMAPVAAEATGLVEAWRAAAENDKEYAVSHATRATAQPRRDQAAALWKPNVGLSASAGLATSESQTQGAQFSAPGFGQSTGVGFSTSVTNGTSGRWSVSASQPLYNPERRAQQQQLELSADLAELEWQAAGQSLMLRTAQRYFDVALAGESVRVLRQQLNAVQRATTEARDRFELGAIPVTATHEASARLAGVHAQLLAAESELEIKLNLLADSTALAPSGLATALPGEVIVDKSLRPLQAWLADAQSGNPGIRMQQLAAQVATQEAAKFRGRWAATVDLVAQAGRERLSGSGDYGSASNAGNNRMIGIQLNLPLYSGGFRDAKERENLQLAAKADAEVDRLRQQIAQQVRAAWLGIKVGVERVQALTEALDAGLARRDATQLGVEVGQRTTMDLLNAENDTAAARLALAQGRVAVLLARLQMSALAGQLNEAALLSIDQELAAARP